MKLKSIILAAAALAASVTVAEVTQLTPEQEKLLKSNYQKLSDADKAKYIEAVALSDMVRYGGRMTLPGTPKGRILVVSHQKRVPLEKLAELRDVFYNLRPYAFDIVEKDAPAELKIRLVDEQSAPSMTLAPDDGVATINVAKLGDKDTKPAFLAARTRKEIVRAFAYMTAGSTYGTPLFNRIASPKDLDDYASIAFPFDVATRSANYLKTAGVIAAEEVTYSAALRCGYDVAPTNECQRAIYERLRKTVKFDKKVP